MVIRNDGHAVIAIVLKICLLHFCYTKREEQIRRTFSRMFDERLIARIGQQGRVELFKLIKSVKYYLSFPKSPEVQMDFGKKVICTESKNS